MHGIGDALAGAMTMFIICVFLGGFGVGWLVLDGLPMLWLLLKPFLHSITA